MCSLLRGGAISKCRGGAEGVVDVEQQVQYVELLEGVVDVKQQLTNIDRILSPKNKQFRLVQRVGNVYRTAAPRRLSWHSSTPTDSSYEAQASPLHGGAQKYCQIPVFVAPRETPLCCRHSNFSIQGRLIIIL